MNVYTTDKIRNVVILGHGGAGKTSLVESMAYLSGITSRLGNVAEGNTISDFDKEEIKRKDIVSIVLWFSKNPYYTIDQLALSLDGIYTPDYVYKCLNDPRVGEIFGNLIAKSITQQLDDNRYGILRKFENSWGVELFECAGLTDREKEILQYRFSSEGIHSADAAARQFGVSKTAITKAEDSALKKIQAYQESISQK